MVCKMTRFFWTHATELSGFRISGQISEWRSGEEGRDNHIESSIEDFLEKKSEGGENMGRPVCFFRRARHRLLRSVFELDGEKAVSRNEEDVSGERSSYMQEKHAVGDGLY